MKRIPLLAVSVIAMTAILALSAPTGGVAHHRPGHNPPGHAKTGHAKKGKPGHKAKRGGPPHWAPAWGRRAKTRFRYRRDGRDHVSDTSVLVRLPEAGFGSCNREIMGAVLGGVTGAAVGSQFGKGDGRTLATIGGAIVGALVGGNIGRAMDQVDQNCVGQVLERAPTGRAVTWRNPDNGGEYQVTPSRSYQTGAGTHCRDYQTRIVIDGRVRTGTGTACRQPDGAWKKI